MNYGVATVVVRACLGGQRCGGGRRSHGGCMHKTAAWARGLVAPMSTVAEQRGRNGRRLVR